MGRIVLLLGYLVIYKRDNHNLFTTELAKPGNVCCGNIVAQANVSPS